jgi:hypothetical protein
MSVCPLDNCDAYVTDGSWPTEVHELHQGYLRLLKSRGGDFIANTEVIDLERANGESHANNHGGQAATGKQRHAA